MSRSARWIAPVVLALTFCIAPADEPPASPPEETSSGPAASVAAIPGLIPTLLETAAGGPAEEVYDRDTTMAADRALLSLGGAAVPGAVKTLEHDDPEVRSQAALLLGYLAASQDYSGTGALPALVRAAREDKAPSVREAARRGLSGAVLLLSHAPSRERAQQKIDAFLAESVEF